MKMWHLQERFNIVSYIKSIDAAYEICINDKTIKLLKDVDIAVVGSYITTSDNMIEKVKTLV